VPTLVDGTFVLWESNAILRYLATKAGSGLYPSGLQVRAGIERWLDWQLSTLQPAERPVFWGLVRTPVEQRDMNAIRAGVQIVGRLWEMLDRHLEGRDYLEGERFSLADLVLGAYVHRWYGVEGIERPDTPQLRRWYDRLCEREAYRRHVAVPLT
jgi:glutathione S-transferase